MLRPRRFDRTFVDKFLEIFLRRSRERQLSFFEDSLLLRETTARRFLLTRFRAATTSGANRTALRIVFGNFLLVAAAPAPGCFPAGIAPSDTTFFCRSARSRFAVSRSTTRRTVLRSSSFAHFNWLRFLFKTTRFKKEALPSTPARWCSTPPRAWTHFWSVWRLTFVALRQRSRNAHLAATSWRTLWRRSLFRRFSTTFELDLLTATFLRNCRSLFVRCRSSRKVDRRCVPGETKKQQCYHAFSRFILVWNQPHSAGRVTAGRGSR